MVVTRCMTSHNHGTTRSCLCLPSQAFMYEQQYNKVTYATVA